MWFFARASLLFINKRSRHPHREFADQCLRDRSFAVRVVDDALMAATYLLRLGVGFFPIEMVSIMSLTVSELAEEVRESNRRLTQAIDALQDVSRNSFIARTDGSVKTMRDVLGVCAPSFMMSPASGSRGSHPELYDVAGFRFSGFTPRAL